ncbi:uncharacterized protein LOC130109124 [Lampris incognitus]|uniref:uncharacterized protein LOC130109124 n=1 Tax=Lampris incognitus TaxID=2546036 RepID=UPI0024B5CADC|nr:uncharacterized protein LOC130109124 [Lampris incognitus]
MEVFPSVEDFVRKKEEIERQTSTHYIYYGQKKEFGEKDVQPSAQKRIVWELKSVPFNGIPFQVVGTKVFECHQGKDRNTGIKAKYAADKNKKELEGHTFTSRRKRQQDTKKLDCPALINVAQIICFPGFKINENKERLRREHSKALRSALEKDPPSVQAEVLFCARFPALTEHRSHSFEKEETVLPHRKKMKKIVLRRECETLLREMADLTYCVQNEVYLEGLKKTLENLKDEIKAQAPEDAGPMLASSPKKRNGGEIAADLMNKTPRMHPFSRKVGQHAENRDEPGCKVLPAPVTKTAKSQAKITTCTSPSFPFTNQTL